MIREYSDAVAKRNNLIRLIAQEEDKEKKCNKDIIKQYQRQLEGINKYIKNHVNALIQLENSQI